MNKTAIDFLDLALRVYQKHGARTWFTVLHFLQESGAPKGSANRAKTVLLNLGFLQSESEGSIRDDDVVIGRAVRGKPASVWRMNPRLVKRAGKILKANKKSPK